MSGAVATRSPAFSSSRIPPGYEWMPGPSSPLTTPLLRRSSIGLSASFPKEECNGSSVDPYPSSHCVEKDGKALKRKRPTRLELPKMQSLVEKNMMEVGIDEVEEDDEVFSVYGKRGRRRHHMEDRHVSAINIDGDSKLAFFGVFDGHGGAGAAEFLSRNLGKHVMEEVAKLGGSEIGVEEAVETGYMKADSHLLAEEVAGGACSVTALVRNNHLVVSNAGDCRAILSINGTAVALTSDHKPSREDERERIERLGGYIDCHNGVWRLQGTLAVSRGFGDMLLKEYVTAEPETEVVKIGSEHEFLILASDGLWDKVSNQEAVDVARPWFSRKGSTLTACRKLAELSISRGSDDDVSVMIIPLTRFAA